MSEKRFRGNTKTKKVQKTLLKQQFKNFTGSSSESLDQIHDRLQMLVSQLEIHRVSLSQEDVNLKFLCSIPSEWKTHTLIWRNKDDLKEHSLDDLFNSLKIYKAEVKHSSSTGTTTQNLAFVSSSNTDSTTDSVSAAASVSAVCAKLPVSSLPNVDSLSNAVIYSFFASQSNSPQPDNKDLKQIDVDDLEEMDLKWQTAMLTMRARRFLQKTGINLGDNGPTSMGFDMSKVECYNCHRKRHFTRECRSYDWSYQAEEEPANFALMAFLPLTSSFDNETNKKHGLGYFSSESDCESWTSSSLSDRSQQSGGYHAIPPPTTGTFMPPKLDLVFHTAPIAIKACWPYCLVKLASYTQFRHLFQLLLLIQHVQSLIVVAKEGIEKLACVKECGSLLTDCDYHAKKMAQPTPRNYAHKGNNKQNASLTHKNPPKHMVHAAVLTQSKPVSITVVRPVSAAVPKIMVTRPRLAHPIVTKSKSPIRRHITHSRSPKTNNSPPRVTAVQAPVVSATQGMKGKWVWRPKCQILDHNSRTTSASMTLKWFDYNDALGRSKSGVIDSGCSRHMTGNMSYLSEFKELNGGYVAFGGNPKGGKISGRGKIKTGKLDFDDVYFVKELKFNLFCVSQMCDKKNSVLFTNTECLVLAFDFKLPEESQVLLRVPRENNMYNVYLKNIVPSGDLTCLFAKATIDESTLWHRRLAHINFKTINKLVKGNLVRGLTIKVFENDNTCVACKKGKQRRASCKTKLVSSVDQPLFRLHMDLFGHTFVKSLNKKSYCLVITDDYSRFTWAFFLATKDKTSPILKTFITGLENQLSLNVKVIRSDNGTEFKNFDLNQFCGIKGIKREFSVPRTPHQNSIAERKNKTLIEADRTMLAYSLLPISFWDEAVNTAYYVQNRVLVTKPHKKTPYELLHGRPPSIGFMRPFGCSGPTWLFDIDSLTRTMNYQPVTAGNQTNSSACFQDKFDAEKAKEEINQQYVLFSVWSSGSTNPQNYDGDAAFDGKEHDFDAKKPESEVILSLSFSAQLRKHDDKTKTEAKGKSPIESFTGYRDLSAISLRKNAAGPSNTTASPTHEKSSFIDASQLSNDPDMPELEDITYSDDENDVGVEADFNNLETSITVSPIPTTRIHKDHPVSQIIGDLSSTTQKISMIRVIKDQGGLSQMFNDDFYTYMFACFLLQEEPKRKVWVLVDLPHGKRAIGTKWVYRNKKDERGIVVRNKTRLVAQGHTQEDGIDYEEVFAPAWYETLANYLLENGFQRGKIDQTLFIKKQKGDILLVQIYVDDIIFGATNKDLCKSFEKLMKDKFQMSSVGELTFFFGLQVKQKKDGIFISQDKYVAEILRKFRLTEEKSASTPIDTEKPLLKDPDGEDVDVHTYRSMIGSLMYLTSSRPNIMFVVCACARFQVTPKALHLHAVKRIFRYLKGKPHLGLWYPKDSPFDLVAYSDSDYAGAIDSESTAGLWFWNTVAIKQINDVTRLQALVDKKKVVVTEAAIREIEEGGNEEEHVEDVTAGDAAQGDDTAAHEEVPTLSQEPSIPSPTPPTPPPQLPYDLPSTSHVQHTPQQLPQAQPQPQPQPQQAADFPMSLLQEALDVCVALTRRVEHLEYDKVAQALEITKLKRRVKKLEKGNKVRVLKLRRVKRVGTSQRIDTSDDTVMDDESNQGRIIDEIDKDDVVALMDDKEEDKKDEEAKVVENDQVQGRQAESQAKIYRIDMDHASKVLSMQKDEPAEVQEVVDVLTTAKLITEVVTTASETVTSASTIISTAEPQVPAASITAAPTRVIAAPSRRRKGVVIRDPEEESTTSSIIPAETKSKDKGKWIMVEEPKPLKKKQQTEMDEEYARKLHAEINIDIDWDLAIDHVKLKAKEDRFVQRYQVMNRKPQTEGQARKNIMMYLKNVAGFKLDYFKGMSYDDIPPIFEAKFNSNIKFLLKTKEQMEEEENKALQSINETPVQKVAKRRKLNKEVEDLKRHLEIAPDENDDVYTEATPLARKVPVVEYKIIELNNKPYYKIIRVDGTHQLYISFLTLLKNFNREDLEALWSLVKERKTHKVFNAAGEELSAAKQKLMLLDNVAEARLMLLSYINAVKVKTKLRLLMASAAADTI
uniref:Putative ribonuclease H-like domain-containing protein n=1 Tax=Tanacetum cinerariifolium TaxID=118510 RepID=A0A699GYQ2_TANCI|nr:putative ribonuclease H-like domain-containing protein [Tanacetum cinerariifolium]